MAKQSNQTTDWTDTADANVAAFASFNGSFVEAMSEAVGQYVEGVATLNQEMTAFVTDRLRQDAAFGHSLAGCRTLVQAAEMQQDWARKAALDYMTEAQKLSEIGQKVMADGARWANGSSSNGTSPAGAPPEGASSKVPVVKDGEAGAQADT